MRAQCGTCKRFLSKRKDAIGHVMISLSIAEYHLRCPRCGAITKVRGIYPP